MKITVLVDNTPSTENKILKTEHGLSLYIEYYSQRIICDMGASDIFAENAELLGINLQTCDFAFISHGHNDHCGGLRNLLENGNIGKVYIHSTIVNEEYFSTRREIRHNLSIERGVFNDFRERFTMLDSTDKIAEGIFAVQCMTSSSPAPYGNCFLWKSDGKKEVNDTFRHEMSLVFTTPEGLIIISPCSHCGALNIMHECKAVTGCDKVHAYIGGLHFVESNNCIQETKAFAEAIKKEYPRTLFFTGHCTCDTAKKTLERSMDRITFLSTGKVFEI